MSYDNREQGETLAELPFSDLQLQLTSNCSAFYQIASAGAQRQQVIPVPPIYAERLAYLRQTLHDFGKDSGTIDFDGMRLRFQISEADDDELYCVLRRLTGSIGELEHLRISREAIDTFSKFTQIRSGLILIMGGTAQGKTTLAAHLYKRLLMTTGGRGITIQEPIEYSTQGPLGKGGFSLDFPVHDNDWASPLQRSLRSNPAYLFVGEILTPQAAAMAISASATGTMVITTIHGGSVGEGLSRLTSMASGAPQAGTIDFYRSEIAKSLVAVITTRLSQYGPDLMVLFGERPRDREEIGRIITSTAENALSTTETGWTRQFNAPRPTKG